MVRNKLKDKRISAGLTQQQMANSVGIDRTFYTNIENGKKMCRMQIWLKIAEVLGIQESELVAYIKDGMTKGA